jgi:hypothetical protein
MCHSVLISTSWQCLFYQSANSFRTSHTYDALLKRKYFFINTHLPLCGNKASRRNLLSLTYFYCFFLLEYLDNVMLDSGQRNLWAEKWHSSRTKKNKVWFCADRIDLTVNKSLLLWLWCQDKGLTPSFFIY